MLRLLIPVLILLAVTATAAAAAVIPVDNFSAVYNGAGVDVTWTLSDTWHSAGFTIYAGEVRDHPNRLVANIPVGSDPDYHVFDVVGRPGAWYWLYEIDQNGQSTEYGPIQADGPTAVSLTTITTTGACYCEKATHELHCKRNSKPSIWQRLSCRS